MINQYKLRLLFMTVVLGVFTALVVGRLFTIQVLDCKRYAERSRDQTQQRKIIAARRGSLMDRSGKILAESMQNGISVESDILGVGSKKKNNTTHIKRVYPYGDVAGPLLGYVGTDGNGLGGAELSYERYLKGEDGWVILQKDGRNNRYRKIGLPEKAPRGGCNVALTIDINIQKIAQSVLKQAVATLRAKNGLCIVMDPNSGAILAMANEPSFNPNIPSQYTMTQRQNRCISMVYEPGSTFKLVTAAAAMQEHLKSENDLIFGDNGSYQIFNQTIRDHVPYGYLTFAKALTYSSNICFAKVANELGNDRFCRYVRDFGFGEKTMIYLPGEECGIVHPVKKWSGRTRVTMAMGQELSVTLLQMMQPYAAIANGGVVVSPRIIEKIVDTDGMVIDSGVYKAVRRVVSEDVASRLRMMLKDVVINGTGKRAAISQVAVAGKTGTSQKPDSGGYSQTRSWSSFIGFVPVERPILLCGVMIDEPAGGEMGGEAAAPFFRKIITQVVSHPELEFAEKILESKDSDGLHAGMDTLTTVDAVKYAASKDTVMNTVQEKGCIPNCVGKDLRDAVNMMNVNGFTPYAIGFGVVTRQLPSAGVKSNPAAACTLYCSVRG